MANQTILLNEPSYIHLSILPILSWDHYLFNVLMKVSLDTLPDVELGAVDQEENVA